ncbi:unnamed protein product, partial [marine sediment metagenome]
RRNEISEAENKLAELRRDAKSEEKTLKDRLTRVKTELKVNKQRLAEFASLKADLAKSGMTIPTLIKLAREFTYGGIKS